MVSWLKKYGLTILKDIGVVLGFVPQIVPQVNTLTGIANIIQTVEAVFAAAFGGTAKTGAAKLQAVQPQVSALIQEWLAANFPGSAKIGNQTLFAQGVTEVSQGVVDILNSIETAPVTSTPVPAANPPAPTATPQPVPAVVKP